MPATTHDVLRQLVKRATCKPGWRFHLVETPEEGLRLRISVTGPDAGSDESEEITIWHYFPVPTATYNEPSWQRWMFECCRGVENHELGEFFRIDGERPFAPLHGPGEDPYTVHEYRPDADRRMRQDGTMRDTPPRDNL